MSTDHMSEELKRSPSEIAEAVSIDKKGGRRRPIRSRVNTLGSDVISTPEFRETYNRRHHLTTSVARHSIRVAGVCVVLSAGAGVLGIKVDRKLLIVAALCHDLGMLNRDTYRTARETYRQHPVDAVPIIEESLGIHDEKLNNAVEAHMYPLNGTRPRSKEAVMLIIADKIGSVMDLFAFDHIRSSGKGS